MPSGKGGRNTVFSVGAGVTLLTGKSNYGL